MKVQENSRWRGSITVVRIDHPALNHPFGIARRYIDISSLGELSFATNE
jgi:hypothetical protein